MVSWYNNVPAPTDSNGRVVPLDTKELVYEGETLEVYGFDYSTTCKDWFVEFEGRGDVFLGACTMLDSWERLEEDLFRAIKNDNMFTSRECAYANHSKDTCDGCKFDDGKCGCTTASILEDVVSRMRKLAVR